MSSQLQSPPLASSQWGTTRLPNINNNTLGLRDVPPPALPSDQHLATDVWSLYNKIAKPVDAKYIRTWVNGLNGIMIFAALFAGVISTLLVDSKQLLQPDSNDATQALLYFLAAQTTGANHTDVLPANLDPTAAAGNFKPPIWAILVNGCFLASLTFSVLAALGAIVCLEWVLEYDEPPESAPSILQQALRRHFRFKAMKRWYMGRLIVMLPLMLYLVVVIFFCGLTIWVWHTCRSLATLPLLGILLTLGGSLFTNVAAIISPCVPFQTVTTKGILRVFVSTHISMWYVMEMSPFLFERWWISISTWFQPDGDDSKRKAERRLQKSRMKRRQNWKDKVQHNYPWMPEERPLRIGVHADRREEHTIKEDKTLKLSALAWLANFMELCPTSAPFFACILEEMNNLKKDEIHPWGESDFEAPWGSIFKIVVHYYNDPASRSNSNLIQWREVVADLQVKMVCNPPVFSRIVPSILKPEDLYEFLGKLQAVEISKTPYGRVMEGIFTILSHPELDRNDHNLCFEILGFVLEHLEKQAGKHDSHLSVAWVFPFCATAPGQLKTLQWDDILDEDLSFNSLVSSSIALRRYIAVVDDFMWLPRLQNLAGTHREGVYSNNLYVAITLLIDYLVREHLIHHTDGILANIPTPRNWALRLVRDNIAGEPVDERAFQELCKHLIDPETSVVAGKVIQKVAASMSLSHWTDVFTAMLLTPNLQQVYSMILPSFVNASLILPRKQKNKIQRATTMLANAFRWPPRQNTSNMENGVFGTPLGHGTPSGYGTPLGPSSPKPPRTGSPTPLGSSDTETRFLTSFLRILRTIAKDNPNSVDFLLQIIDEKRNQPLHDNFPALLDKVYDQANQVLLEPIYQSDNTRVTIDPGSSSHSSGVSIFGGDIHQSLNSASVIGFGGPGLSPIHEQGPVPLWQVSTHSPQHQNRSLPDLD